MNDAAHKTNIPAWTEVRVESDDLLVARVNEYFARYGTPRAGGRILVALSGGPDSVALLAMLRHLAQSRTWTLAGAHVNYQLRGDESDEDETFCRELCSSWGIPLHVHHAAYSADCERNRQAWARAVRYAYFDDLVTSKSFDHVAIGHTLDDRAETVAAAVIEARGTFALSGIPPTREKILRPLFLATRAEVMDFLNIHRMPYREDSSNASLDYTRNRIRHELLPAWGEINPAINAGLARMGEQLWQQETFLFELAARMLADAEVSATDTCVVLNGNALTDCDAALDPFVLRVVVRRLGMDMVPSPATVARFTQLRRAGATGHVEQGRLRIEYSKGQIVVQVNPGEMRTLAITFAPGESFQFGSLHFRSEIVESPANPSYDDNLMALMDLDHLTWPFVMRAPIAGDSYEPYGLHGHKKVADILADRGVPAALRGEAPILVDATGIVWPVGHPIAERAKVTSDTRSILRVRVETA